MRTDIGGEFADFLKALKFPAGYRLYDFGGGTVNLPLLAANHSGRCLVVEKVSTGTEFCGFPVELENVEEPQELTRKIEDAIQHLETMNA